MNMNKKLIVTVILTITLLFSTMSTAFGDTYTDIDNNPHQDAILEMSRLGILAGVGNDLFAPTAELNRAAAAKVAGYLLGFTEEDASVAAQTEAMFKDIEGTQHAWALGWINLMTEEGILRGVGDGLYAPGDPLQKVHWVTILTRILQHEQDNMVWPDDYDNMANSLSLDRGLYYVGSSIMNRSEMARMTTTALYNVERPDGQKIIDVVTFEEAPLDNWHVNEQIEPNIYDNAEISVQVSKAIVPTGGGQTITITVAATYGANSLPAANTNIEFFANAGPHDRRSRLSAPSVITDANGIASVTYTTLSDDDNLLIEFLANIHTNNDWVDKRAYALVSNSAAYISGRVINPFNGSIVPDIEMGIDAEGLPHTPVPVDEQGYYGTPVNVGTYYINFNLKSGTTSPYPGEYRGSHFSINNKGDIWFSMQQTLVAGNSYTLPSELGVITGTSGLAPGTDIYITAKGTNNTHIATIGANGRFLITLAPGIYEINNRVGTTLKANISIQKGSVTDVGGI
ncbi:S-layer homology domain-containing protein [Petrocella sp. FN5]|uniref:S-layer homology domain-containing protein n=1 Tax=Petrocella sp. FN5 TaxID=3032002 RepID=UPI0023DBC7E9|nr:S-layer homology domain-containing protein [Petrocella sp. FN5]MDF1618309.1 S-layer homology domain-containing protein [Petrocella sp. FN5]